MNFRRLQYQSYQFFYYNRAESSKAFLIGVIIMLIAENNYRKSESTCL